MGEYKIHRLQCRLKIKLDHGAPARSYQSDRYPSHEMEFSRDQSSRLRVLGTYDGENTYYELRGTEC
jgi:hypothetical protein